MRPHAAALALHRSAVGQWPDGVPWDARSVQFRELVEHPAGPGDGSGVPGDARAVNWLNALARYESFWWVHRRSPREKTRNAATLPDDERRMGEWARYQRRTAHRLCAYQVLRLDASPAFAWNPQQAVWEENFNACRRHLRRTGTLPRLSAASAEEFALARWLGRQLRRLQDNALPEARTAQLHRLLYQSGAASGVSRDQPSRIEPSQRQGDGGLSP